MIEWQLVRAGSARSYKEVPEGAEIVGVNGRCVEGRCESCGRAILEGQKWYTWTEGILTCEKCGGPESLGPREKGGA